MIKSQQNGKIILNKYNKKICPDDVEILNGSMKSKYLFLINLSFVD